MPISTFPIEGKTQNSIEDKSFIELITPAFIEMGLKIIESDNKWEEDLCEFLNKYPTNPSNEIFKWKLNGNK